MSNTTKGGKNLGRGHYTIVHRTDESGVVEHIEIHERITSPPPPKKPKKRMTYCQICGVRVRVDNYKKHKRKVHPDGKERSAEDRERSLLSSLVRCPVCQVRVRDEKLDEHIRRFHETRSKPG